MANLALIIALAVVIYLVFSSRGATAPVTVELEHADGEINAVEFFWRPG